MNKNIVGGVIAVVAVLGIVGVVMANKAKDTTPSSGTSTVSTQDDMSSMDMANANKSQATGNQTDLTSKTEVSMDISNFAFAQKSIKIKKGTKITWTNQDEAHHNVVASEDGGPKGQLLAKGESYSFTFDTVGTFNYHCEPHPYMKAVVNVIE